MGRGSDLLSCIGYRYSRTMLVRVDPSSPTPLNEQIAAGIRRSMVAGKAGPGDRLPPAKELARSLDVNMHTVLKAYARLRDDGLVEMRRGRGVTVVDQPAARASLVEAARSLVEQATQAGYLRAEILELVEVQL